MTREPLESFDSAAAARDRLPFWAGEVARLGLAPRAGVYIDMIRLSPTRVTFGIFLGLQPAGGRVAANAR